jgi:hypothetical protein
LELDPKEFFDGRPDFLPWKEKFREHAIYLRP